MSWLSKAGKSLGKGVVKLVKNPVKAVENIGRSIGKATTQVAPALSFIPGVGPLAAAGLGAAGSVAAGNNIKTTAKTALTAGGGGLLKGALSGIKAIPGISSLPGMSSVGNFLTGAKNALGSIPGVSAIGDKLGGIVDTVKQTARAANGGKAITLGTVGDLLKKGGSELLSHPELAAAGISGYSGYQDAKRGGELENDAIATMRGAYDALQPNRARDPLDALYADPGNPYSSAKRIRLQTA